MPATSSDLAAAPYTSGPNSIPAQTKASVKEPSATRIAGARGQTPVSGPKVLQHSRSGSLGTLDLCSGQTVDKLGQH